MGHVACKPPQNTRAAQYRYKTVSAPLLQFADDTLPSLTLVNAVEGTRFGIGSRYLCALVCSGEDAFGVRAKFRNCEVRFGELVVLNFDQTPSACDDLCGSSLPPREPECSGVPKR
jgi:hypothetical protein